MKKLFIGLFAISFLALAVGYIHGTVTPRVQSNVVGLSVSPEASVISASVQPTLRQSTAKTGGKSGRLIIPKLNIDASVESVGLDAQRNMDVPKNAQNVAWYNLGVKPGEKGNAVMAGHYDTVTGAPAVFYKLATLTIGDEIKVRDQPGTEYTYQVKNKETHPNDTFPLQEVFGITDKYRLNLITCSGQFNNASNNYSHRTVVYSELVKD